MEIILTIAGLGILFRVLDIIVSRPNPDGCAKLAYLVVGGLFIVGLTLIALACFTYPLWEGKF